MTWPCSARESDTAAARQLCNDTDGTRIKPSVAWLSGVVVCLGVAKGVRIFSQPSSEHKATHHSLVPPSAVPTTQDPYGRRRYAPFKGERRFGAIVDRLGCKCRPPQSAPQIRRSPRPESPPQRCQAPTMESVVRMKTKGLLKTSWNNVKLVLASGMGFGGTRQREGTDPRQRRVDDGSS